MKISIEKISWEMNAPFAITGYVFDASHTVRVTLSDGQVRGRGEACGVYYHDETVDSMAAQLEAIAPQLEKGLSGELIQQLLPPGGARNALDCAFWDYRAKSSGKSIWQLLKIRPKNLRTVFTLGMDSPQRMGEQAAASSLFENLKIKLGSEQPIECLEAIRAARPDANLIVDVNQGWTFAELKEYVPHAKRLGIAMIEQPLPIGADEELEFFRSDVPLGADESCCHLGEFETAASRYDVINIKLDKCGGLTEGLALVESAQNAGVGLMVGNMMGSSLSMAPSYVIGQYCQFVDIDGPLLLKRDIEHALNYRDGGLVDPPTSALWG